ncbi:EamA family transporter RarD [Permianibacter aggregans]|uniref:Chloramphenicol-sensitive protein RarD n=1 Tax=Permianibacter aggregans TaxID=1510150 RepID=A0A4R6URW2_9GAMM|nr:EamA family transporter RarD [Permianibacter aggregans]QGX39497.1 EamA family transporter RarD [Permianibacter aggregans]TDQ49762.1 chloramphenicol-sensitive protein RarD [Permianibacter aggregans]
MASTRAGVSQAIAAYLIWGLAPIYFKWLSEVPADEILAHRIAWSVPVTWLLIVLMRQPQQWLAIFRQPSLLGRLAISAALVSANWFVFVWAIANNRILDTSLGYFINPLLTIALGVVVLKEHLSTLKWAALLLALVGVGWQVLVIGGVPWVSLSLATTFALYGLMRKQTPVSPLNGLMVETLLLAPIALAYLYWLTAGNANHFGELGWRTDGLLMLAGVVTSVPLALFAAGARRLTLTTMGFLQYIAPSCTFLLAIFVYQEPFSLTRLASFACIWAGLVLLSIESLRDRKRQSG